MKKIQLLTLAVGLCLLLRPADAGAQQSKSAIQQFLDSVISKKEDTGRDTVPAVSRKRAPASKTSRKAPSKGESKVEERQSGQRTRGEVTTRRRTERRQQERTTSGKSKEYRIYRTKKRSERPAANTKAKCGVPGCQHPGKHKGLHKKQNVVRPIRKTGGGH